MILESIPLKVFSGKQTSRRIKMLKYLIIFEKTETGYSVYVPDLPGCVSTGATKEEAEKNIAEAIEMHIESMLEDGETLPAPTTESEVLLITKSA
jgi:predicted RNase H-like HicB family nuclease